jgi:hypothetical protein
MKKQHLFLSVAAGVIFLSRPLLGCEPPIPPVAPIPPPIPAPVSNAVPVVNIPGAVQVGQIGSNAVNVTGLNGNRHSEPAVYAKEQEPSEKDEAIAAIDNSEAVELAPKNPRN